MHEDLIYVSKGAWILVIMWVAVATAKALISEEPFKLRRFIGEIILAAVGGFTFYAFGMYEDMQFWQMMFFGGMGGLGGVHALEQGVKAYKAISKV